MIEGYRRMTPAQKARCVSELTIAVQKLALLDIRRRHPDESDREHALRLASRWLPRESMVKAFGWDPEAKGY